MSDLYRFIIPAVVSLIFFLLIQIRPIKLLLHSPAVFKIALLAVLLFHLGSIFFITQQVGDVMLFSKAGYYFRNGVDFYQIDTNHGQYPFFPFLIFFHAAANKLTYIISGVNFVQILKLLLLIALYAIGRLIYLTSESSTIERRKLVLEFLVNPITYCVILFHGQIDVILIALFMYASRLLMSAKSFTSVVAAGLLFAASVATKTWSILLLPLYLKFFGLKNTFIVSVVTISFLLLNVFVYTRLVFGSGFMAVLPAVLKPGGPVGIWGLSLILSRWNDFIGQYNLYIFGALLTIGLMIIYLKKVSFWNAATWLILWIYIIIPNWGIQYLFWIVPFLFVTNTAYRSIYLSLAGFYLFLNYAGIAHGAPLVSSQTNLLIGLLLWSLFLARYISIVWLAKKVV
jgi:hypothetical protein